MYEAPSDFTKSLRKGPLEITRGFIRPLYRRGFTKKPLERWDFANLLYREDFTKLLFRGGFGRHIHDTFLSFPKDMGEYFYKAPIERWFCKDLRNFMKPLHKGGFLRPLYRRGFIKPI